MSTNTILASAPLTTTNYVLKANGTTLGNSLIFDNGTGVGINTSSPDYPLTIQSNSSANALKLLGRSLDNISIMSFMNNANSTEYGYIAGISSEFRLNATGALPITYYTNGTERMRITSGGDILFGFGKYFQWAADTASAPTRSWAIRNNETANGDFAIVSSSTNNNTLNTTRFVITSGGNVGIGSQGDSGYRLIVRGSDNSSSNWAILLQNAAENVLFRVRNDGVYFTGTLAGSPYNNTSGTAANMVVTSSGVLERYVSSSARYKEEINDWDENGLKTILALKPRTFKYKKDYYDKADIKFLGLIAEEVAEVSEYLADFENQDRTGQVENVRYANIVVPLIKAVQEQQALIQELSAKVSALENKS